MKPIPPMIALASFDSVLRLKNRWRSVSLAANESPGSKTIGASTTDLLCLIGTLTVRLPHPHHPTSLRCHAHPITGGAVVGVQLRLVRQLLCSLCPLVVHEHPCRRVPVSVVEAREAHLPETGRNQDDPARRLPAPRLGTTRKGL